MGTKTIQWTLGLALLACAVVFASLYQMRARTVWRQADPRVAKRADLPIPVRTVKVDRGDLTEVIGGTAVTMPSQSATVMLPNSTSQFEDRRLSGVHCWRGATVAQDDLLFEFDGELYQLAIQYRQALLSKAEQELKTVVQLVDDKAASLLQLRTAEVEVEAAKFDLELAQNDFRICSVRSPLSGVVDDVKVVPSMRLTGGTVLATVHQLDPVYVQMDFPMERLDSLKIGQTAEVTLDAYSQETFVGKVIRISPVVSTRTRVLPVVIEVPNPENRILAGISGFARVVSSKSDVTTVPSVAVINQEHKAMVFTVEEGRAQIREVRTGTVTGRGGIEILTGLAAGEEVVIYGHDILETGDMVNVDWERWARRR